MELIGFDTILASYFLHHPEKKESVTLGTIYKLKEVFEAKLPSVRIDFRPDQLENAILSNSYLFDWDTKKGIISLKNRKNLDKEKKYFISKVPKEIRETYMKVSSQGELYTQVDQYIQELAKTMGRPE